MIIVPRDHKEILRERADEISKQSATLTFEECNLFINQQDEYAVNPVSERALIGRINRKLAEEEVVLRKTRPHSRLRHEHGTFYVDGWDEVNGTVAPNIDIDKLGRELAVLSRWEYLVPADAARRSNSQLKPGSNS
jgi:hypothetical protein